MLFNSRNTNYKTPFGAVKTGETVTINFPVPKNLSAESVNLIIRKDDKAETKSLSSIGGDGESDVYSLSFYLAERGVYFYRFEINTGNGVHFIGSDSDGGAVRGDWLPEWQLTVYDEEFQPPNWLDGGLIYHIFPDRFAKDGDTERGFRHIKNWNQDVTVVDSDGVYRANDFFGGNIKGVIKKLPYLKELGVTAIYFSPIFESSSNHRYDTGDYMKIDSLFGTEEEFEALIEKADEAGIGIILDGVFNHTGADSIYFNKFGRYPSLGAYQSQESPYYPWYTFFDYPDEYACWWGVTVVPTVKRDSEAFQEMIAGDNGVLEKWTRKGVKGWRLDVADELSTAFLKKIYRKLKSMASVAVIGEVWEDASTKISYGEKRGYLLGGQLDGVMNYPFRTAIIDYVKHAGAELFVDRIMEICENYPRSALFNSMTLLGTHDTVRIINELSGVIAPESKSHRRDYRLDIDSYALGKTRLYLASVLQYALPGIPTVYYGDEIGMQGFEDPINRRPYPAIGDLELLEHYKKLGKIRKDFAEEFMKNYSVEKSGDVVIIKRGILIFIVNATGGEYKPGGSFFNLLENESVDTVKPFSAIIATSYGKKG